MLVSMKSLLDKANKGKYAVGAFNINNLEIIQAVAAAAAKLNAPVILQTSESAIAYAGIENLVALAKTFAGLNKIPIALHLDHGKNPDVIKKAINSGYTSVMIDASDKDFDENIRLTKQVVSWAKNKVSVEAELGTLGGKEDYVSGKVQFTDPDKALEFIKKTRIDALAVAIGTSHGAYKFKGNAELDIARLKEIKNKVKIPLVLHGASGVPQWIVDKANQYGAKIENAEGVPDEQIKLAIKNGINKINTDTDIRLSFTAAIREFFAKNPSEFDPRKILAPAKQLMQQVVEQRIKTFGSGGKA